MKKDRLNVVIRKEPKTPQDFMDLLCKIYPKEEILDYWMGFLHVMKWNQDHRWPLRGRTLREAISLPSGPDELDPFLDPPIETDFFDEFYQ